MNRWIGNAVAALIGGLSKPSLAGVGDTAIMTNSYRNNLVTETEMSDMRFDHFHDCVVNFSFGQDTRQNAEKDSSDTSSIQRRNDWAQKLQRQHGQQILGRQPIQSSEDYPALNLTCHPGKTCVGQDRFYHQSRNASVPASGLPYWRSSCRIWFGGQVVFLSEPKGHYHCDQGVLQFLCSACRGLTNFRYPCFTH